MYIPTKRQISNAKKLGIKIKSSSNPKKKLDIFKNNIFVCSIGANGYNDYYVYKKHYGIQYAKQRQKLYKIRHNNYRKIKNTPSYYADKILWS